MFWVCLGWCSSSLQHVWWHRTNNFGASASPLITHMPCESSSSSAILQGCLTTAILPAWQLPLADYQSGIQRLQCQKVWHCSCNRSSEPETQPNFETNRAHWGCIQSLKSATQKSNYTTWHVQQGWGHSKSHWWKDSLQKLYPCVRHQDINIQCNERLTMLSLGDCRERSKRLGKFTPVNPFTAAAHLKEMLVVAKFSAAHSLVKLFGHQCVLLSNSLAMLQGWVLLGWCKRISSQVIVDNKTGDGGGSIRGGVASGKEGGTEVRVGGHAGKREATMSAKEQSWAKTEFKSWQGGQGGESGRTRESL
jgi:hypothetical protein